MVHFSPVDAQNMSVCTSSNKAGFKKQMKTNVFGVYHICHTNFARQSGGWWLGATHDLDMTWDSYPAKMCVNPK